MIIPSRWNLIQSCSICGQNSTSFRILGKGYWKFHATCNHESQLVIIHRPNSWLIGKWGQNTIPTTDAWDAVKTKMRPLYTISCVIRRGFCFAIWKRIWHVHHASTFRFSSLPSWCSSSNCFLSVRSTRSRDYVCSLLRLQTNSPINCHLPPELGTTRISKKSCPLLSCFCSVWSKVACLFCIQKVHWS